MEFTKQAHCVYYARYHFVFVTKYRRNYLKGGMGAYLSVILKQISRQYPGVKIIESKTDMDHIHMLVSVPPKFSISDVVKYMKGYSSHEMRKRFKFLTNPEYMSDSFWSDGYFFSTVGVNEDIIRRYVEHQGEEDRGQAVLVI